MFITMNPGYIGRAELPESLKALFRPITVVVPDRQLIMENMLMAEGFVTGNFELKGGCCAVWYLVLCLTSTSRQQSFLPAWNLESGLPAGCSPKKARMPLPSTIACWILPHLLHPIPMSHHVHTSHNLPCCLLQNCSQGAGQEVCRSLLPA